MATTIARGFVLCVRLCQVYLLPKEAGRHPAVTFPRKSSWPGLVCNLSAARYHNNTTKRWCWWKQRLLRYRVDAGWKELVPNCFQQSLRAKKTCFLVQTIASRGVIDAIAVAYCDEEFGPQPCRICSRILKTLREILKRRWARMCKSTVC